MENRAEGAVKTEHFRRAAVERAVFCLTVFFSMLVFFAVLHPIPIMDEDDVLYTVLSRPAIPIPGYWNPSRMMPEVLMPLCGNLAALCARLGFGSFIDCQVFLLAAMLSGFITAYVYAFRRLLELRFHTESFTAVCLSGLFLLLHFLIFRTDYSRNLYMFYSYDACCVFYYTMPALLCCTLVLYFMASQDGQAILTEGSLLRKSLLVLALYFALFSNLFGSVILAVYAGFRVLRNLLRKRRAFLKNNVLMIGIVVLWLIAVCLEATGGRAGGAVTAVAEGRAPFLSVVGDAAGSLAGRLAKSSLLFRLMTAACAVAVAAVSLIRPNKEENQRTFSACGETLVCGVLSALFIVALSAAARNPEYAGRPQAIFPVVFCVFLLIILSVLHAVKRIPGTVLLLPILLVFVFTVTNTRFLTFADSNPLFIDGRLAVEIENDIYGKIVDAAEAGETEVTVQVPKSWELMTNWPHNANIGNPMAEFFLKYGLIDRPITVHTEPSEEYNEVFGIHPDLNRMMP